MSHKIIKAKVFIIFGLAKTKSLPSFYFETKLIFSVKFENRVVKKWRVAPTQINYSYV